MRIVHGRGRGSKNRQPVLKGKLRKWLRLRDEVLAFCQAPAHDGGGGALLVLSLFLVGNFQNFLDSTQIMLLGLFEVTSLLFVVSTLFFSATTAILAIRKHRPWRLLPVVLSLAAAGGLFGLHWLFKFLLVWLNPVN